MTGAHPPNTPDFSHPLLLDAIDNARVDRQSHSMARPSDAEKYRWIRANRGNIGIVDALARCDKDTDFDDRIAAEMAMCAAGVRADPQSPGGA